METFNVFIIYRVAIFSTLLLCLIDGQLIDPHSYATKVVQRLVDHIESAEVTGASLPINDFENELTKIEFGLEISGRAKYHSGFVSKIKAVGFSGGTGGAVGVQASSIDLSFQLLGVTIFYDVEYKLKNYEAHGTIELRVPIIRFDVNIVRKYGEKWPIVKLTSGGTSPMYDLKVLWHPNNGFTQLWSKAFRTTPPFMKNVAESYKAWSKSWEPIVEKAVADIEFPKICYYCPEPKKKPIVMGR